MAANRKFTPRASSNLIEEEVTEIPEEVEAEIVADFNGVEETPEKSEKTEEVTFKAETDSKPIERMVKIRLAKKYDGCIGGVWYHFAKDQVVNVPENVKRILNSNEGMLKPL